MTWYIGHWSKKYHFNLYFFLSRLTLFNFIQFKKERKEKKKDGVDFCSNNNGCIDMYDSWVSVPAFCYRIKQSSHLTEIYNGVLFKYGN